MCAQPIRLLLVDGHVSFRMSVAYMLKHEPEFRVVDQVNTLADARRSLETNRQIDVALADYKLPDGIGLDLLADLHARCPTAHIVLLTGNSNRKDHARAVAAGAAGIVPKSASSDDLKAALRRLCAGEPLLPHHEMVELLRLAHQLQADDLQARTTLLRLTPRELEILRFLARGLSDKEIAGHVRISTRTVGAHTAAILNKLGVDSRIQAVLLALRHGIVELE